MSPSMDRVNTYRIYVSHFKIHKSSGYLPTLNALGNRLLAGNAKLVPRWKTVCYEAQNLILKKQTASRKSTTGDPLPFFANNS